MSKKSNNVFFLECHEPVPDQKYGEMKIKNILQKSAFLDIFLFKVVVDSSTQGESIISQSNFFKIAFCCNKNEKNLPQFRFLSEKSHFVFLDKRPAKAFPESLVNCRNFLQAYSINCSRRNSRCPNLTGRLFSNFAPMFFRIFRFFRVMSRRFF